MELRQLKGMELAARKRISYDGHGFSVPSQSGPDPYRVTLRPAESCTCEDFQLRQLPCKHVFAARFVQEREFGGHAPALDTEQLPRKPTYRQDWPAYNLAQAVEKRRFQVLLCELCRGVAEPAPPRTGRRPHAARDALFAMALKVYSGFSSRRFACDLEEALNRGHLSRPVPGLKVNAFLESAAFTPILKGLIAQSSLPLRAVETVFAPDSSGFSTSRFVRWFDEKYGAHRSGHDWVKVHLMCGVKTQAVTAVEIRGRDANDAPILPDLLKATLGRGFNVKEVPADKGYSSVDNIEAIHAAGATAYIAFKSNATGGSGGLWEKLFHYYNCFREEFLRHYHKRSNVESVFSMIKAKFRDHIRSRTDTAMVNEALCKVLCHNICVLIQSQCELGIEASFWDQEPDADPDILPMPARGE
jgi:transposase